MSAVIAAFLLDEQCMFCYVYIMLPCRDMLAETVYLMVCDVFHVCICDFSYLCYFYTQLKKLVNKLISKDEMLCSFKVLLYAGVYLCVAIWDDTVLSC